MLSIQQGTSTLEPSSRNNNPLSFSVYVDSRKHMKPHRRTIKRWVNDDSVIQCYKCTQKFSLMYRKHHCRACGKIFCYACIPHIETVPKDMVGDLPSGPTKTDFTIPVKVCQECQNQINKFNKFNRHIKSRICDFDLIKLTTMVKSDTAGPEMDAAIYCYNKLREIQYKLPKETLSPLEKQLLVTNTKYFYGHSRWTVQLMKIGETMPTASEQTNDHLSAVTEVDNESDSDGTSSRICEAGKLVVAPVVISPTSCWITMCSRGCHRDLQLEDILELLGISEHDKIISQVIDKTSREVLLIFLPLICTHINQMIVDILYKRFNKDDKFMNELYWSIKTYNPDESTDLLEKIKELPIYKRIEKMNKIRVALHDKKITAGMFTDVVSPVDPSKTYSFDKTATQTLDSASKPIMVKLINQATKDVDQVLYKFADVRNDHIAMNLMRYVEKILQDAKIPTNIVRYSVYPMTTEAGLIEIVKNAKTMYDIKHQMKFTVQNYINEYNPDRTSKQISERFMHSAAVYSIMSYLLGVGDRHLDNIMVTKDGLLFHIDFDYILGRDPKYSNSKYLKITSEIINVIGGYNSKNYNEFKQYCVKIYNQLRLHINQFMMMLMLISDVEDVRHQLLSRFEVGESMIDAAVHMNTILASGSGKIIDNILDWLYQSKKSLKYYIPLM